MPTTTAVSTKMLFASHMVIGEWRNVRYWPKADIPSCTAHVRFRD